MKFMLIFGTRPEGIKMLPLVHELKKQIHIETKVLNTAQHREMLDQVLEVFDVQPDFDLDLMKNENKLDELMAKMIVEISSILESEKPDYVFVHGDTLTTLMGAQAAFFKQIPVIHIEAGLRTHNLASPFPEEANRQVVGRYTTYHFAATEANKQHLLKENIPAENIFVVGNTVIDALLYVTNQSYTYPEALQPLMSNNKKTILVTTHRRENLQQLKGIYEALNTIISENEDVQIIFPAHKNPVVRNEISKYLNASDRVHLIEPQDYVTFSHLMKDAYLIVTDSGGIQEEAPSLGTPVVVVRDTTERPEGIEAGTIILAGTEKDSVYKKIHTLLHYPHIYQRMAQAKNPYGDGSTSQQIVSILNKITKTK